MERGKQKAWLSTVINLFLAAVAIYLLRSVLAGRASKEISYTDFLAEVRADRVKEVQITEKKLIGVLKEIKTGTTTKSPEPPLISTTRLPGIDKAPLLKELEAHGVNVSGKAASNFGWITAVAIWVLPLVILALIYRLSMSRMGGALTFGKSRARIFDQTSRIKVTFTDVAGVDEAKAELDRAA